MPKWASCQNANPKAITWELRNSGKIRTTAKTTTVSKSEWMSTEECANEQRNCSNSQNSLKESCSLEPYPLLTASWKALARKNIILGWNWRCNFYLEQLENKGFEEGLLSLASGSNASNVQLSHYRAPLWLYSTSLGRWYPSSSAAE